MSMARKHDACAMPCCNALQKAVNHGIALWNNEAACSLLAVRTAGKVIQHKNQMPLYHQAMRGANSAATTDDGPSALCVIELARISCTKDAASWLLCAVTCSACFITLVWYSCKPEKRNTSSSEMHVK